MVFVPIVGIYADGILSMLGVHPFIQLYGMFMSIQINSAILTHITFYRMKIIIPMSFRYYTQVIRFGIFSTVFMYVGAILSVNSILLTIEDQMTAKNLIYVMVLVVVVCIIMPFSVFFAGMADMITNPVIIPASLIFALCHGSASTLIHLLSNKPFRDTMKTQLSWVKCLLTCSRLDRSSKVHTMSSIVG
ncbi:hypothetical protein B9Z55_019919 [Caenorhabditis nigoni]|uniref:Uncharacterized protein n=1 Tax=Caenorhabditis nigoni TaxID=1611254 RepID=A0A2G5TKF8_9PELO|nr:hypothetical protein B9Z55_019919 [Caenorhabditis nigoni]